VAARQAAREVLNPERTPRKPVYSMRTGQFYLDNRRPAWVNPWQAGLRWRSAYLARLYTVSALPPAPAAGLIHFSSSAVRLTIERFPSVPDWFG
jgi:hypothetical protein